MKNFQYFFGPRSQPALFGGVFIRGRLHENQDDVESHVQNLSTLGIKMENYGALISILVLEKLFHDVKLIITRNVKGNTQDLAKILELINQEHRARETGTLPDKIQVGKNGAVFDLPYTSSSLHTDSYHPRSHSSSNSPGKKFLSNVCFIKHLIGQISTHIAIIITIHILSNISRSKDNQRMKFGQLIKYNKRNIFLQKSYRK